MTGFLPLLSHRDERILTCQLCVGLWQTGSNLSYFSLVILTLDRYVYITRGLRYSVLITKTKITVLIVVSWLMAVSWGLVSFILIGLDRSKDKWPGQWTVSR